MTDFLPIPAVDVRGGRAVRLQQGDFARETVYVDVPAEAARRWEAEGAQRLHVVDLDGARDGVRQNASAITQLLAAVSIPVQVGGGIRDVATARDLLDAGVDRVVVGTAVVEDPASLQAWLDALDADRLIVAVDARDGRVATHGWTRLSPLDAAELCRLLAEAGVQRVLYTDISRDGTLEGPNIAATARLVQMAGPAVLASGGVSSLDHLRSLAAIGAEGAIVGKALYDGRLTLADVMAAVGPASASTAC